MLLLLVCYWYSVPDVDTTVSSLMDLYSSNLITILCSLTKANGDSKGDSKGYLKRLFFVVVKG